MITICCCDSLTLQRLEIISEANGTPVDKTLDLIVEALYTVMLPYLKQEAAQQACLKLDKLAPKVVINGIEIRP